MNDDTFEPGYERERAEILRNLAEERKLLREADEISARLKYGWLRIGLAGAAFGITLFLFVFNNFIPLLRKDLELAQREREMIKIDKAMADASLKKAQETLVDLKAQSDLLNQNNEVMKKENEDLKTANARLGQLAEQGRSSVDELKAKLEHVERESSRIRTAQLRTEDEKSRAEQAKAQTEQALTSTHRELQQISQELETMRRASAERAEQEARTPSCNEFNVIQESVFKIPGLDYTLKIGDMSKRRVMSLEVLRNGMTRVGQVEERIPEKKVLLVRDGDANLLITFLSIEAQNLIPGVREDSGVIRVCTDRWNGEAGQ